jgi:phage-related protein
LDGSCEFEEFLDNIPEKDSIKLLTVIESTESQGLLIAAKMKWIKKLEKNLYELRSEWEGNIQRALYFQKMDNQYLVTHGFTKKTQKTPRNQIKHARRIREKYEKGELK